MTRFCLLSPPEWVGCYAIALLLAGALLHLALELIQRVRCRSELTDLRRKRVLKGCLGLLATGVCFAFFYESMFLRFSCVNVFEDRIVLSYFWPKPSRVILVRDITAIRVERDRKHRGELVVSHSSREVRSIVCPKGDSLDQVHAAIAAVRRSQAPGQ